MSDLLGDQIKQTLKLCFTGRLSVFVREDRHLWSESATVNEADGEVDTGHSTNKADGGKADVNNPFREGVVQSAEERASSADGSELADDFVMSTPVNSNTRSESKDKQEEQLTSPLSALSHSTKDLLPRSPGLSGNETYNADVRVSIFDRPIARHVSVPTCV